MTASVCDCATRQLLARNVEAGTAALKEEKARSALLGPALPRSCSCSGSVLRTVGGQECLGSRLTAARPSGANTRATRQQARSVVHSVLCGCVCLFEGCVGRVARLFSGCQAEFIRKNCAQARIWPSRWNTYSGNSAAMSPAAATTLLSQTPRRAGIPKSSHCLLSSELAAMRDLNMRDQSSNEVLARIHPTPYTSPTSVPAFWGKSQTRAWKYARFLISS